MNPGKLEYYFRQAFGLSDVMRPKFVDDLSSEPEILAIGRPLVRDETKQVTEFLEAGGTALLVVADENMSTTLGALAGIEAPEMEEFTDDFALLERIDFDHPALVEFRDPRWRDFTKVNFWRHREIDPAQLPEGATVFAKFDSGSPAWIDIPLGGGSLLVMMSGWHPRDSNLNRSSKFLPLLFSMFSEVGPKVGGVRQFFVGQTLPRDEGVEEIALPGGKTQSVEPGKPFRPEAPGVYRAGGRAFAVNLRPSESELTPLADDALTALGVPVGKSVAAGGELGKRELRNRESEAAQNLWRWAVVVLLLLLAFESWLGSRSAPDLQSANA